MLGKKRLMPEATNKKGKHHKTYDPLADLGFDLDEVLSQLAQPPELDGMSLILDDSHERPSVLTKRDRPKEIATRPKAKKRKTPENHFDLTVDNLFYLNQETNVFELDEAVLAEIKNTLSTTPITSINFNQETNNATVIWWLVFAGYSSNKELVGIMDVVLAALHGKINLEYAPSGRLNYLSINLMMQYARTSFWPKHADTQFTLRTLLKTHKKPQRILEDMGYQENLLNTDFFDSFNSMNI